jgi:hypothetical protein
MVGGTDLIEVEITNLGNAGTLNSHEYMFAAGWKKGNTQNNTESALTENGNQYIYSGLKQTYRMGSNIVLRYEYESVENDLVICRIDTVIQEKFRIRVTRKF